MIALVFTFALTVTSAPDPCAGVLDRTTACASPDDVAAGVVPDAGGKDPALGVGNVIKAEEIPSKLALLAAALGIGGTAVVGVTYAVTPPAETPEQEQLRKAMRLGGVSVLALSGLVGGAAVALAVFDPSTGKPRYSLVEDDE